MKIVKNMFTRSVIAISLVVFLLIVTPVLAIWGYDYISYYSENKTRPFDLAEWEQAPSVGVCGMYEDIKNNVLELGMTKRDIISMLGAPKGISDTSYDTKNHISYDLGQCDFMGMSYLILLFDQNDRLTSVVMEKYD